MDEIIDNFENNEQMELFKTALFRRQGINHLAKKVNADVMALGHNLDDMAQTVLMNMSNGDMERTLRLAPHTATPIDGLPPRIVPLRWIPEQEVQDHSPANLRGACSSYPGAPAS